MTQVGDLVRMIRDRLPFGRGAAAPDSPLPYVARRPSVNPILPVADMAEAIGFYRGLGFVVESYGEQYAWVRHCGWEFVHLRLVEGLDPLANETTAFVHVEDADRWRSGFTTSTATATVTAETERSDVGNFETSRGGCGSSRSPIPAGTCCVSATPPERR